MKRRKLRSSQSFIRASNGEIWSWQPFNITFNSGYLILSSFSINHNMLHFNSLFSSLKLLAPVSKTFPILKHRLRCFTQIRPLQYGLDLCNSKAGTCIPFSFFFFLSQTLNGTFVLCWWNTWTRGNAYWGQWGTTSLSLSVSFRCGRPTPTAPRCRGTTFTATNRRRTASSPV